MSSSGVQDNGHPVAQLLTHYCYSPGDLRVCQVLTIPGSGSFVISRAGRPPTIASLPDLFPLLNLVPPYLLRSIVTTAQNRRYHTTDFLPKSVTGSRPTSRSFRSRRP